MYEPTFIFEAVFVTTFWAEAVDCQSGRGQRLTIGQTAAARFNGHYGCECTSNDLPLAIDSNY